MKVKIQKTNLIADKIQILTNKWVIMNKVVQCFGSKSKASNNLSGLDHFTSIGDDATIHEIDDAVAEHFWMDAKIAVVTQFCEDGVREWTNTWIDNIQLRFTNLLVIVSYLYIYLKYRFKITKLKMIVAICIMKYRVLKKFVHQFPTELYQQI